MADALPKMLIYSEWLLKGLVNVELFQGFVLITVYWDGCTVCYM